MPTSPHAHIRRLFAEGFTAMDLAEPFISFDAEQSADAVRTFMEEHDRKVVGLRRDGVVVGYARREDLVGGSCDEHLRAFREGEVLADDASLRQVVAALVSFDYVFVALLGRVGAIISRTDLEKPAMRMWLFGMITILEISVAEEILAAHPDGSWRALVTPGRLEKASALLAERERRNEHVDLLGCLQLSDKLQVLMKDPEQRRYAGFESKKAADRMIGEIEALRNNLAHAQNIVASNWNAIVEIASRQDRIVERA